MMNGGLNLNRAGNKLDITKKITDKLQMNENVVIPFKSGLTLKKSFEIDKNWIDSCKKYFLIKITNSN